MREFVITKEFSGTLEIENNKLENIRCVYKDDYYSNKIMKGTFYLNEDQSSIELIKTPFQSFVFFDMSGRTLKGDITGMNHGHDYNDRFFKLNFKLNDFLHRYKLKDSEKEKLQILFHIPYIMDLSRHVIYSYDLSPDYIFKFNSNPFKIVLNDLIFEFYEKVYCRDYNEPDSIFTRELFIKALIDIGYKDVEGVINSYKLIVDDIMLIISFLLNHRMTSFGYNAELFDNENNLIETIEHKNSSKPCGKDCLKKSGDKYLKFFTEENLSNLIEAFQNKTRHDKKNITKLLYKFLILKETEIFQAKFLSGYVLLESISKFIVKPTSNTKNEQLIKDAIKMSNIEIEDFEISRHRKKKPSSQNEFEITEYRDELIHFNNQEFSGHSMWVEYQKIVKVCRKLLLWIILPDLSNWGIPEK